MIKCSKCGYTPKNQSELDEHHIIPKWIGGRDIDGRLYLCKENIGNDCHRKLHKELNGIMKSKLKEITLKWLKNGKI